MPQDMPIPSPRFFIIFTADSRVGVELPPTVTFISEAPDMTAVTAQAAAIDISSEQITERLTPRREGAFS